MTTDIRTGVLEASDFDLTIWESVRNRGIAPTYIANTSSDDQLRREFLIGARLMGYELIDLTDEEAVAQLEATSPRKYALQPQQLWIVDALNAEGYDDYVVEIVRRASKTTTIFCWLLGRCWCRPDYQVTYSAQNGVKSSARLREWKSRLDRTWPDPEAGIPPWRRGLGTKPKTLQRQVALFGGELAETEPEQNTRGFRILMGEVGKGIYFDNGATFLVFKPDAEAYRGEGGDVSWIDEAQELDPESGAELLAGLLPLQDTKAAGAVIISGTAGEARVGPLWERVNKLRTRDPDIGGLDYCAPEETPWEYIEDEEKAIRLLLDVHPGIGTLTTEEKMRKRWRGLERPKWAREYLSLWPETFGNVVVDPAQWEAAQLAKKPPYPQRVAFGVDIKPNGSSAAIVAAWRTDRGVAHIEIVEHRSGTVWIPTRLQELTRTYRGSTVAYDDIAEGKATATEAARLTPKPKLQVQTYRETAAGCVQIMRDLERGTLRHSGQNGLNAAVTVAAKRETRGDQGVWLWTPSEPGADITPLVAATRALRNWDQHFARGGGRTSIVAA